MGALLRLIKAHRPNISGPSDATRLMESTNSDFAGQR